MQSIRIIVVAMRLITVIHYVKEQVIYHLTIYHLGIYWVIWLL